MEHCIVSSMWAHLNHHHIITTKQHGFRNGMSCETQLIEAMNDWTSTLNKGKGQIDVILLDFSKAFDVVPHQRLLLKLRNYGITGKTNAWINAFLTGRSQEVVVNGTHSVLRPVRSGVPQGTVLGPLLFLIYINDIEKNLSSSIRLFADDSALYRSISSLKDAVLLQEDLFKLQNWAITWQMAFNVSKCKLLRITYRKTCRCNFIYRMYHQNASSSTPTSPDLLALAQSNISRSIAASEFCDLEEVTSDRYLGVILDNKLNFNKHIDEITNKATKLLNLCRRNLHMCSREIKTTAYFAIIRPHLDYASTCWNPYTKLNIDKIEAVQRRAARFVLNYYDYSSSADLSTKISQTLKWKSLQHRRALADLCMFYKIRNNFVNIPFPPIITPSIRHANCYNHVQALHSEAFKYQFFVRSARLWNTIPHVIKIKPSVSSFSAATSNWILSLRWIRDPSTNTWVLIQSTL